MDNYTKGKWESKGIRKGIVLCNDEEIAVCWSGNGTIGIANAERIVQCVNNFDDLLEVCKGILAKQQDDSIFRFPDNCEEIINLRKAIQKAERVGG